MLQPNEIYLNGNNSTVQIASAHETSEVMVYEHPLFGKVRMFVENGKSWFCVTDIATSLQYANPRKAIIDHCKSQGVTLRDTPTNSGIQQMKFISEGNIYRLTAKSQMPRADEFENWIFDEIVPSVVNTLFKKLREAGVFFANRNEPKQKYIDAGYFEMKEKPIPRENHPGFVVMVVLCTQKGLAYINHLFGGKRSDRKLMKIA